MEKKVFDVGDTVICDLCGKDYTKSNAKGGFLFGSNGVCPDCQDSYYAKVKKFREEHYISAWPNKEETFKQFILRMRNGNNTVTFVSLEK